MGIILSNSLHLFGLDFIARFPACDPDDCSVVRSESSPRLLKEPATGLLAGECVMLQIPVLTYLHSFASSSFCKNGRPKEESQ
jgi:hypothetical protein